MILRHKHYDAPSVFTAENLLREARRQKGLVPVNVPPVCVLDPDGDIGRQLRGTRRARVAKGWPCYHTDLLTFEEAGLELGLVPCAVGAPFAVLVAEELFASGCRLLISVTSAGQITDQFGLPPYFVLIEEAWRDEGTSHHYLPPSDRVSIRPGLLGVLRDTFVGKGVRVNFGGAWTTDAPFRETEPAIRFYREQGVAAVEMEAAALYAFAEARAREVVCFAHVTNQMAVVPGDFEKGRDHGIHDALEVVRLTARSWLEAHGGPPSYSDNP